jgi:hypothetical protein
LDFWIRGTFDFIPPINAFVKHFETPAANYFPAIFPPEYTLLTVCSRQPGDQDGAINDIYALESV